MQPIKKDGTLFTNENDQLEGWQEYFKEILNLTVIEMIPTASSPSSSLTDRCDEAEKVEENVMEKSPNEEEIKTALKNTKSGKAPGLDNIPPNS
jgi:hypothetical protein